MNVRHVLLSLSLVCLILSGCSSYKANLMLKAPEDYAFTQAIETAEKNYLIAINDQLKLTVHSNDGERIIDPDFKLAENLPNIQNTNVRPDPVYLVDINGKAKLPMVGEVVLAGLTIRQAEAMLQTAYEKYYAKPYVILENTSKRVIVLGAPGGVVVPLIQENMSLAEVVALSQGITNNSRANNIRLVRNEDVYLVDFSTIDGFKKGNMIMEPGDIVYIEPIRRPATEAARDFLPVVSIFTSFATLLLVLLNL